MKGCEQATGLSVYHHGLDVANRYRDLYEMLLGKNYHSYDWDIDCLTLEKLSELTSKAMTPKAARLYHIFHDCGKPRCLKLDENGRKHFPNHADISAQLYAEIFEVVETDVNVQLIKMDMLCHTAKGEELEELAKHQLAPTLILTALAELHSNAEKLFGGFESTSFKIKRKQLIKATKAIHSYNLIR
jgi:hypothetical protein